MTSERLVIPEGTYIVAVSGGIDSVVLLDMLFQHKNLQLIVAHFDHGIRDDSAKDAQFVRELAESYGLAFEAERTELGKQASESDARKARYNFLRKIFNQYKADAIITAHHQDDTIETSMINILRGTGRRGLTSLRDRPGLLRPLLSVPKQEIINYAQTHSLSWREDSTNTDKKYLRNKLRHDVVAKMSPENRQAWLKIIDFARTNNEKLDTEVQQLLRKGLHKNQLVLSRQWFIKLPHDVCREIIHSILARAGAKDVDKKTVERLVVQVKTLPNGKKLQAGGVEIFLTKRSARFKSCSGQEARNHV